MKKIFIGIVCFLILACAVAPVQNPICPKENSWICEQSGNINVQPETIYGWIYSATAIAAVSDVVSISEICDFEQKIADWYIDVYPIDYNSIINKVGKEIRLIKDPKKALLIENILNKNLMQYNNPEIIKPADDEILRKGHVKFRKDMLCN